MSTSFDRMKKRVWVRGDNTSADQWTRMREDKLRSLKGALRRSYQAAIVQPYSATNNALILNITSIITAIQDNVDFSENQLTVLKTLQQQYESLATAAQLYDQRSTEYISVLNDIIKDKEGSYFRCLINHDKLKVEYQDKIISIPFEENTVTIDPVVDNKDLVETNFHNGTVFKWIHGNKEEWIPDTYWIVYMQYSEETAYFRGQIRKADEEINIIVINDDGSETEKTYRGWMTGPNETSILWNVKKGVVWNDMNYTKLLYITKDEDTLAYFNRFDRVTINGKPWQVQAYNDNYGTSSNNIDTGIIRVALKETYTSTDQQIKEMQQEQASEEGKIIGADVLSPYDEGIKYAAINAEGDWSVELMTAATENIDDIISYSIDSNNNLIINVVTSKAYKKGFNIKFGDLVKHITIKSL